MNRESELLSAKNEQKLLSELEHLTYPIRTGRMTVENWRTWMRKNESSENADGRNRSTQRFEVEK
jgi:hypothetical protein